MTRRQLNSSFELVDASKHQRYKVISTHEEHYEERTNQLDAAKLNVARKSLATASET